MVRLPGDRSIVVCSLGFPGLPEVMEETVHKAIRGGVPIHTLDMSGVGSFGPRALAYLANNTGGRNIFNNNDFDLGLQELLRPPPVSYLLGFTPDGAHDGRYHSLKIRLPGHKGYLIEARPGIFRPGCHAKEDQPSAERPIDREVLADDTRNDVPVTTIAKSDKLTTGEPAVWVMTHVDISHLAFRLLQTRHIQKLRVVAALFDQNSGFVAGKEGEVEFALKDASLAELSRDGVNATMEVVAPAGDYRVTHGGGGPGRKADGFVGAGAHSVTDAPREPRPSSTRVHFRPSERQETARALQLESTADTYGRQRLRTCAARRHPQLPKSRGLLYYSSHEQAGDVPPLSRSQGALGCHCCGRRRHGRGRGHRCRQPRLRRATGRAERLRQRHFQPQHQAGPRRRPLPGTGQRGAGDGGP